MRLLRSYLFLSIYLSSVGFALAQKEGMLVPQSVISDCPFSVHQYFRNEGLSGNNTLDIMCESDGHVIFAMEYGVYLFNGYVFKLLPVKPKSGSVQKLIHNQTLNISFGLTNNKELYEITPETRYLGNANAVCTRDKFLITVGHDGVLSKYYYPILSPVSSTSTGISNCTNVCYNGRSILVSDLDRVYEFSSDSKDLLKTYKIPGVIQILEEPASNSFILVCSNSIYRIIGNKVHRLFEGSSSAGFTKLSQAGRDSFYVSSYTGLHQIFPAHSDIIDESGGLPSHSLNGLALDSGSGRLWVATGNKGVLRLEPKLARTYYRTGTIGDRSLGSITAFGPDKLAIVENDKILVMDTRTDSISTLLHHEYPEGTFVSLAALGDTLAVGTWGNGLFLLKDGKKIGRFLPPELPGKVVTGCFRDRKGHYWIATNNGIAFGHTLGNLRPLHPDKISTLFISFYQLRNGDVCAGGESGVVILSEDGEIKHFLSSAEGLVCKEIRAFYEDDEGLLWIGASAGGLYCYENGLLTSINRRKHCVLPPDIFTLACARDGNVYMSTNNSLWAVNINILRKFYRNSLHQLIPFRYSEAHGILNTEFNGGFQNNFCINADGTLYFPTVQGLVAFKPPVVKETELTAYIDYVMIDGILSNILPRELNRHTKNIEITAGSINLESNRNSYWQYKLERAGIMSVWSTLSKENKIGLLVSEPGDYTLFLRAVDALNPENGLISTYSFTIKPYFYEYKWVQIAGIIAGLFASVILVRFVVRRREIEREKAFQEKTNILSLEMQALQSRMNPHFVFNILNNLKSLVSQGRTEKAEKMIGNFSILLRKAFEKSTEILLPLGEEIAMAALYLKLQQERFNHSFTFHIHCPEELKYKLVPSFILQPIVENCVNHGISHSEKPCHIDVNCTDTGDGLVIVVKDNGVGRKQSAMINRHKVNHRSTGLELIERKLSLTREMYGMNNSITLEDADPVREEGTIATIKISYHG